MEDKTILIKVGGKYRVRMGGFVKIDYEDKQCRTGQPFKGDIVKVLEKPSNQGNHIRIAFFAHDGRYNLREESQFDIVEEIKEDTSEEKYLKWKIECNLTEENKISEKTIRAIYEAIENKDK